MVGVPMHEPASFSCPDPKLFDAQIRKFEAIKHIYRLVNNGEEDAGQLVCVECGRVSTIDCDAFQEFSHHVRTVHGFAIDLSRTVLYGRCPLCAKGQVAAHA